MAPKGGRGGGSRGGGVSISSCPGAFSSTSQQVYFASDVIFLTVYLVLSFVFCSFRKKSGAGKKLIGPPFIFALFLTILSFACSVIASVLRECGTTDYYSYYDWQIAIAVFTFIANWLILFILVWQVNTMLRAQLGPIKALVKVGLLAALGVMGALTLGYLGLSCYNTWTQTNAGQEAETIVQPQLNFGLAYWILYLLTILGAGALALLSLSKLRKQQHPAGTLIGWTAALYFFTVFWVLLVIVFAGVRLSEEILTLTTAAALSYLINIFSVLTFVAILCIAKHAAWGQSHVVGAPTTTQNGTYPAKEQFAYNAAAPANGHTSMPPAAIPQQHPQPQPFQHATVPAHAEVQQQQQHQQQQYFYNALQPGQQPPPGTVMYYYQQTPNGPVAVPVPAGQGAVQGHQQHQLP